VKWYRKAAKQGNKEARHNLDLMGDQDQVSKDRAEKEKWHRGATEPKTAPRSLTCELWRTAPGRGSGTGGQQTRKPRRTAYPPPYGGPLREGEVAPGGGRTAKHRRTACPPSYGGTLREGEVAPGGGRTAKRRRTACPPSYGGTLRAGESGTGGQQIRKTPPHSCPPSYGGPRPSIEGSRRDGEVASKGDRIGRRRRPDVEAQKFERNGFPVYYVNASSRINFRNPSVMV